MNLFRDLDALPERFRGGAVAIGNFDGVHLGHAEIARRLKEQARRLGTAAVAFTFDPHPGRLLRPAQMPPPLTGIERKAKLLTELGLDAVVAYPTDKTLLQLTPREFFDQIVRDRLRARALVEGPDFCFGRNREGTIEHLRAFAAEADMLLEVVEPVKHGEEFVSSSRVRRLLAAGEVQHAAQLLTRPYEIEGPVARGAGRGTGIGFPTANVTAIGTLLPGEGVYAGAAHAEESIYPAAINIGANPTFGENVQKVEAHLIGFDGALYDRTLKVDFFARLRDVRRHDDVAALRGQLADDVRQVKRIWKLQTSK